MEAALLLWVLLLLLTPVVFGLGFTVNTLLMAVGVTLAVWAITMAMRAPRSGRRRSTRSHG